LNRALPFGEFSRLGKSTERVTTTKRRIEISIDRQRLFILKRRGVSAPEWCSDCGERVQMLTPDQAAMLANVSSRTIYRRVEAGEMHYNETAEGRLLICPNSIRN
jgi:hypothetical protein